MRLGSFHNEALFLPRSGVGEKERVFVVVFFFRYAF